VGTIKSRIARARDRLIELLGYDAAHVAGAISLSEPVLQTGPTSPVTGS
jgi:hypothetical protein